jgi:glutamyl-tRNA reductase
MISAVGSHRQTKKDGSEVFLPSLEEIHRILENKRYERQSEERETKRIIPKEYHEYADVFSKQDSNTLPPYRKFTDYRIVLEEGMTPGYCPLYKQSEEECDDESSVRKRRFDLL